MSCRGGTRYPTTLSRRTWLSKRTFELELDRPEGFDFIPGQGVCLGEGSGQREYSLACGRAEPRLTLCIRRVGNGPLTSWLATVPLGQQLSLTGPHGFFAWQESPRQAVFVATGTGVAPFLSMARSGCKGFTILHGVPTPEELYYRDTLQAAALRYVPCLSGATAPGAFHGRVTEWVRAHLAPGSYDFYLCGRREMVRDVTSLVDDGYPGSRVYAEIFH
jgi:benzoate/toluate 1,2-dioxygenase reductase subunit